MTLSIERRAALWEDRTAVVDYETGETIAYADLARRARDVAARLRGIGIGEGDVVAVVSRNRPEVLSLLFGVARVGAALAPISHRLTPATVTEAYGTVDPDVVIHEAAERDLVRAMDPTETCRFEALADADPTPGEPVPRDPDSPFLYLASPETGDESAVVELPARQVEWNCITAAVGWGLGRDDAAPTLLPLSLPDGLLRLTLPLLYVGGRVVLARAFDPADTLAMIGDGVTHLFAHEKEYRELAEHEAFEDADLSSLSLAACGDRIGTDLRNDYRVHGAAIVRSYGRAEAGPNALTVPPGRDEAGPEAIGRPFPDCEVRLVDDRGEPVSVDEVGRLEMRGPLTAMGYRGGESFGEWVATGDRARRDEDGDYHLVEPEGERSDDATGGR